MLQEPAARMGVLAGIAGLVCQPITGSRSAPRLRPLHDGSVVRSLACHRSSRSERKVVPPAGLEPGSFPNGRQYKAVTDVVVRVAVIEARIREVGVSQTADVARPTLQAVRERGTNVIQSMRKGIIRNNAQTGIVQVLGLEFHVQGIVVAVAVTAALVDSCILIVWTGQAGYSSIVLALCGIISAVK